MSRVTSRETTLRTRPAFGSRDQRSRIKSWPASVVPAMAAGVTAKLWDIADIVGVIEEWEAISQV
jgi:hypothetical protein